MAFARTDPKLDDRTLVRRCEKPLFTRLDDELLAIDPQSGECYSLTGSAIRIWELLAAPTTADAIAQRLVAEFEVDAATCLGDVLALLRRLAEKGLIERCERPT